MSSVPTALRLGALLVYTFLYLPVLVVAVYSFNAARYGVVWTGFTTGWYTTLFENALVAGATTNTLILAVLSTLISTVLGSLLGYGLRHPLRGRRLIWLVYLPLVIPDIVLAVSLLLLYAFLRQFIAFENSLLTMVLAHVTFQISFVAIVVRARLASMDSALEEAAADLYAGPLATLRYVVVPLAWPAILAGALIAFTLSIDDFVISFFTSGPTSLTLPIFIYTSVKRGIAPEINALSTLLVFVSAVGAFMSTLLQRK